MYCIKCGRQIEDGSSFCVYCGAAQMKPGNDGAGSSRKQSAGGSSQGRSRDGGRDGRGQNRNYSQGSGAEWDSADYRGDTAAGRGAPQGRQYGGPAGKNARGGSGYGTDYYEQPGRQGGGILPIVIAASVLIFFLSLIVGFMLPVGLMIHEDKRGQRGQQDDQEPPHVPHDYGIHPRSLHSSPAPLHVCPRASRIPQNSR